MQELAKIGFNRPITAYSSLCQPILVYSSMFQPISAFSPIPNLKSTIPNLQFEMPNCSFYPQWHILSVRSLKKKKIPNKKSPIGHLSPIGDFHF